MAGAWSLQDFLNFMNPSNPNAPTQVRMPSKYQTPQQKSQQGKPFNWPAGQLALQTSPSQDSPQGQDFDSGHRALDAANYNAVENGVNPFTLEPVRNPLQDYVDQMNTPFNFDPKSVDTTWVDNVLAARNAGLDQARGLANKQFNTSDQAIGSMGDQYRNAVLSQAPQIQQQNQDLQGNTASIFDKTIQDAQARQAANDAARTEMFQRLGIQQAANQPDLAGQEIQKGINDLNNAKGARVSELGTYGQTALNNNQAAANAMLGQAQIGRQQLNMRLQDILGSLAQKGADYNAEAAQQRAQWQQQMYGNAFNMWKDQRDFARDEYNKLLTLQQQKAIADERWGPQSAAMLRASGAAGALNGSQGLYGLNEATAPNTQADYYDILAANGKGNTQSFDPNNIANIADRARQMEQQGKLRGSANDVIKYVQYMQNMARMKAFPQNVDPTYSQY